MVNFDVCLLIVVKKCSQRCYGNAGSRTGEIGLEYSDALWAQQLTRMVNIRCEFSSGPYIIHDF